MKVEKTEKIMKMFADKVIKQARKNLGNKGSGKLASSHNYELKVYPSGALELIFTADDHAKFVDKGVQGNTGKPHPKDGKVRAKGSPYKYTNKMPPTKVLDKWVARKSLKGTRNAKGQFIKRKSIVFAVAKSIQLYGLPATKYFEKAFNDSYKSLPKEAIRAYASDVTKFLRNTTRNTAWQ